MSHLKRTSVLTFAAATISLSLVSLTGCGIGTAAIDSSSVAATGATISGHAFGGQQPVVGSTVSVVAVGTSGYGAGATTLASVTSTAGGAFSFVQDGGTAAGHYSCPSSSALLYLLVSSGDPTGAGTSALFNPAIKLVSPIGACAAAASGVYVINEVTTAATAAALAQYIDPVTEQIGAPSTGSGSNASSAQTGITNAFATVQQMVALNSGIANTLVAPTSTVGSVTATYESAKLNSIGNTLAACVNTTGSGSSACNSLFAAATPPTIASSTNFPVKYATTPTAADTFQAALFMQTNPTDAGTQVTTCNGAATTSNIACLYSLSAGVGAPFTGLAAAPTDWNLAVTYASSSTQTVGGITEGYLAYPQRLAIDKAGNVWVTNNVTTVGAATSPGVAGLTELSPTGGILQQVLTGSNVLTGPRTPTFDSAGNVWVPNYGTTSATNSIGFGKTVVEYNPTNGTTNTYNVAGCPTWLAGDGAGNMFVGDCTTTAVNNTAGGNGTPGADLEKISAGAASGTPGTVLATTANGYSLSTFGTIGVDSNFNVWDATGGTTVLSYIAPYTGTPVVFTATNPEPLAIDSSNNTFVANYATTAAAANIDKLSLAGGVITNANGFPANGGGLVQAELSAIDGAGNFWVTVYPTSTTGYVTKFAGTGAPLSPTNGFVHTFTGAFGIAVDPSGNVWVGNNTNYSKTATAATGSNGGAAAGGYVTEIIGAAVPVITPIAAGLPAVAGGTSKLATPPQ